MKTAIVALSPAKACDPWTVYTAKSFSDKPGFETNVTYIQTKIQENDVVLLGTRHKQPEILAFITELIPKLKDNGVTHLGVEIPSDQQDPIDIFMKTGNGLDEVQFHAWMIGTDDGSLG